MRILVISDSHGNIMRLRHVYGFVKETGLDAIIHCGDWDNADAANTTKDAGTPVYGVLGNADTDPAIQNSLKEANVQFNPSFLKLDLDGRKIGVCHFSGKLTEAIKSQEYDALFHGHRHRRKKEMHGKTLVVNPGALQGAFPSFAVYDTETNAVEFIMMIGGV